MPGGWTSWRRPSAPRSHAPTDVEKESRKVSDLEGPPRARRRRHCQHRLPHQPQVRTHAWPASEEDLQREERSLRLCQSVPRRLGRRRPNESIRKHGFAGPYICDRDGGLARTLGATHSTVRLRPRRARTVIYRGAVDDRYGQGYTLDAPAAGGFWWTRSALRRCAATGPTQRPPWLPAARLRLTPAGGDAPASPVTYHGRISRLLQTHCVECHHPGGGGSFSLRDVKDVHAQAAAIQGFQSWRAGSCPPGSPPRPAGKKSRWSNDRTLPPQDKADLLAWLASGTPDGDPHEAPMPRQYADDWQIGTPDPDPQIPKPVAVKASGVMPYQEINVETKVTS